MTALDDDFTGEQYLEWAREQMLESRVRAAELPTLGSEPLAGVPPVVAEAINRWVAGEARILVLTGPVGVGKTTLAARAFRRRLVREPGKWRSVPQLIAHLGLGFGTREHDEAVRLLDGRRMLALDDLDKARPTEYVAERLFAAIDGCYANGTGLVVTSNLTLSELGDRWPDPYGAAITSRLSSGVHLALEGADRRPPAA